MTDTAVRLPRLKQQYRETIIPSLREEFGYANVMQVPGLTKIVVNTGVGEAARDALAREVRPVLHQLLGRDVERGAHA